MFCQLLAPVAVEVCGSSLGIEEYRVMGRKEARMLDAIEPVMAQHRLVFDRKAISVEENQKQLTRLYDARGALARDDRVDVLAAAVKHWYDILHLDVDTVIAKNKEEEKDRIVKEWLSDNRVLGCFGDKVSGAIINRGIPSGPRSVWEVNSRRW